ncbi:MAG: heme exporter protein CcmD [Phenylobacterium sp.]|uniref:heme exporter protein CcmD n=1 Tax=Phenylobacterium sp. TaxID=1871053 RepID=UPI00391A78F4
MLDLDAGAYAAFVWPAFAITALVFALMVGSSLNHARHWRARTEALRQTAEAAEREAAGEPKP